MRFEGSLYRQLLEQGDLSQMQEDEAPVKLTWLLCGIALGMWIELGLKDNTIEAAKRHCAAQNARLLYIQPDGKSICITGEK